MNKFSDNRKIKKILNWGKNYKGYDTFFYDLDMPSRNVLSMMKKLFFQSVDAISSISFRINYYKNKKEDYKKFHFYKKYGKECIDYIYDIFQLDPKVGIKFGYICQRIIEKDEERSFTNEDKTINFIRNYFDSVKLLINKNKSPLVKSFKPDRLLDKILGYGDIDLIYEHYEKNVSIFADDIRIYEGHLPNEIIDSIFEAFQNPIFVEGYIRQRKLPAYSWSAKTGEPMMRALVSGDYRKSYNAERRLIKRAVRDIGERYE